MPVNLCVATSIYASNLPRSFSALNFMMQRVVRNAWTIAAHRGFTTSLPSISCYQISRRSSPRAIFVWHRTIMSRPQWTCTPKVFPTSGFELLDQSVELEEETLGAVDSLQPNQMVYVTGQNRDLERELHIFKHMNLVETNHPGRNFIRKLIDHFYIQGPHGRHICLVHEPLGTSADILVKLFPGHIMSLDEMKPGIRQLLVALDFLHSECHIIHTDIQLKNLLLPGPKTSVLTRFEEAEVADPSPRKMLKDRTIYKSLGFLPKGGLPILADFGEARLGDEEHSDDIMSNAYRASEVMLRSNWGYKVDIWNVAMVAWHIVSPSTLISGKNLYGVFDDRAHMAELVALLGPRPPEFREQRHLSSVYCDESDNWKEVVPIPDITFERLAEKVEGKDKEGFLRWLRMALQWNPEDQATALELLYDEWLMEGL